MRMNISVIMPTHFSDEMFTVGTSCRRFRRKGLTAQAKPYYLNCAPQGCISHASDIFCQRRIEPPNRDPMKGLQDVGLRGTRCLYLARDVILPQGYNVTISVSHLCGQQSVAPTGQCYL